MGGSVATTPHLQQDDAPLASPLVSVVIPCLDEELTIGHVVDVAWRALHTAGVSGEVIVSDNGSADGSCDTARAHGARVVHEPVRGYGAALRRGCDEAQGRFIVIGDADESYDFSQMGPFLHELTAGADLVMGTRTRGTILPGAMPWKNRYIGNPALTGILNLFFRSGIDGFE